MTQIPLTLSTRAFFPTHDRAYESIDEKSDELTHPLRSDAKNYGVPFVSKLISKSMFKKKSMFAAFMPKPD